MSYSLLGNDEEDSLRIAQGDALYNGKGALLMLLFLLLVLVNPTPKATANAEVPPPGSILIEISWPQEMNADVDLWVQGPQGNPVGYSNKGGLIYNLLRDDLGHIPETDFANLENTNSRGVPSGRHCVNVHLFAVKTATPPIPVHVAATISRDVAGNSKQASSPDVESDIVLTKNNQEVNAFCFVLDEQGELLPGVQGVYSSQSIKLRTPTQMQGNNEE